jgi:hypothetical protein
MYSQILRSRKKRVEKKNKKIWKSGAYVMMVLEIIVVTHSIIITENDNTVRKRKNLKNKNRRKSVLFLSFSTSLQRRMYSSSALIRAIDIFLQFHPQSSVSGSPSVLISSSPLGSM